VSDTLTIYLLEEPVNWFCVYAGYNGGNGGNGDAWVWDGVVEIESVPWSCGWAVNRTTIPLGHCISNVFTNTGDFMVLGAQPMGSWLNIMAQGFSDNHCKDKKGEPFNGQMMTGCNMGMNVNWSARRTPHAMGTNMRLYHKGMCRGGHIDHWSRDYQCSSGSLFDGSRSYIAMCGMEWVYSYENRGCMGMWNATQLSTLNVLGHCMPAHGMSVEVVCGGGDMMMPTDPPSWGEGGWPSAMPTSWGTTWGTTSGTMSGSGGNGGMP
jgi:hypothetical protein